MQKVETGQPTLAHFHRQMLASAEVGATAEGIASYEGNDCSQHGEKFLEKKVFIQILGKIFSKDL